jgi:hypothetical protein
VTDSGAFYGVPPEELPIDEIDWEHRGDYIRTRSSRRLGDFDVVVLLMAKNLPEVDGSWWGVNAWAANSTAIRRYQE